MHRSITRLAGGAALVMTLGMGTTAAFAAGGNASTPVPAEVQGAEADTPDALPAGAISVAVAQQDALKSYPGGTAVLDGANDQNGTITYGFTVTANGAAYDVQVNALTGAVVQADAGGTDNGGTGGADNGGADNSGADNSGADSSAN